jgi:succinoglycan biosynthesis protein ExoO
VSTLARGRSPTPLDGRMPDPKLRPLVSVITANYNGGPHLAAAVRSVLRQSLGSLELIVVDDASTDDSLAVIREAADGDRRVRVLKQRRNAGPGAARNRALAVAQGRWIAVFDADDLMSPERLRRLVDCAEADWAEIVVDNQIVFSDEEGEPWRPLLNGPAYARPRWLSLADYIGASRVCSGRPGLGQLKPLICAETLRRTGVRYREDLQVGEGYDLLVRLLAEGAKIRFDPGPLYRFRKHPGSLSLVPRREHLEAMLAADAEFADDYPDQPVEVRRALAARRRSLEAALTYDGVLEHLKAHEVAAGLKAGLHDPAVWPLLTIPMAARLRQFAAYLNEPRASVQASA